MDIEVNYHTLLQIKEEIQNFKSNPDLEKDHVNFNIIQKLSLLLPYADFHGSILENLDYRKRFLSKEEFENMMEEKMMIDDFFVSLLKERFFTYIHSNNYTPKIMGDIEYNLKNVGQEIESILKSEMIHLSKQINQSSPYFQKAFILFDWFTQDFYTIDKHEEYLKSSLDYLLTQSPIFILYRAQIYELEKERVLAKEYYEILNQDDNPLAAAALGKIYVKESKDQETFNKGWDLYEKAATLGLEHAQFILFKIAHKNEELVQKLTEEKLDKALKYGITMVLDTYSRISSLSYKKYKATDSYFLENIADAYMDHKDYKNAKLFLKKAVILSSVTALPKLGYLQYLKYKETNDKSLLFDIILYIVDGNLNLPRNSKLVVDILEFALKEVLNIEYNNLKALTIEENTEGYHPYELGDTTYDTTRSFVLSLEVLLNSGHKFAKRIKKFPETFGIIILDTLEDDLKDQKLSFSFSLALKALQYDNQTLELLEYDILKHEDFFDTFESYLNQRDDEDLYQRSTIFKLVGLIYKNLYLKN